MPTLVNLVPKATTSIQQEANVARVVQSFEMVRSNRKDNLGQNEDSKRRKIMWIDVGMKLIPRNVMPRMIRLIRELHQTKCLFISGQMGLNG